MAKGSLCIKAGNGRVTAAQMIDSSALLQSGQVEAAQQRLAKDGYLLLRGYLPTAKVSEVSPLSAVCQVMLACIQFASSTFLEFHVLLQARTHLLQELCKWKPHSCTPEVLHLT